MGKKSPPPKPPDLTPISNAQLQIAKEANDIAREQMGLSREQFAWFQTNAKEELALARQQADRLFAQQERAYTSDQEARAFAQQVGQTQIDAMDLQMDYAKRDRARYESVFLPMEDRYIAEANAYDTPERREAEASRSMVDIQRQVEAQRGNADARLRSMGIDPSQVRSTSMATQLAVAGGANQALAGNQARTMVEDKGRALRADALNIGKGLPAQAAMGFQGAGAAGQGALGAAGAGQAATLGAIQGGAGVAGTAMGFRSGALNNVAALTGSPMQWASMSGGMMGQALGGYGSAANTINSGYQNQMQHWQAGQQQAQQQFSNVMSVAGMAAGMMMAEGGHVSRERMMSAGGIASKLTKGIGSKPGGGATKFDSWKVERKARAAKNDPYTRAGGGSGKGGALSFGDRMSNAMTAAEQYQPTNSWDSARAPQAMAIPTDTSFQPMAYAEGGGVPRVIPRRQSRDKIPALLTEGEYVIPSDVVDALGINHFDKLVSKYHRENA